MPKKPSIEQLRFFSTKRGRTDAQRSIYQRLVTRYGKDIIDIAIRERYIRYRCLTCGKKYKSIPRRCSKCKRKKFKLRMF